MPPQGSPKISFEARIERFSFSIAAVTIGRESGAWHDSSMVVPIGVP